MTFQEWWSEVVRRVEMSHLFGMDVRLLTSDARRTRDGQTMLTACFEQQGERFCLAAKGTTQALRHYADGLNQYAMEFIAAGRHVDDEGETVTPHDRAIQLMQLLHDTPNKPAYARMTAQRHRDGHWTATLRLRLGNMGDLSLAATASPEEIHRAMHQAVPELRDAPVASAGSIFSAIGRIARKIARGRILQRLAHAVQAVARNPLIAKAVGIAASIVPGGAAVRTAMVAAQGVLKKLRAGNAAVRQAVARTRAQAVLGDPRAQRAMRILQLVESGQNPRTVACGFFYHRPARSKSEIAQGHSLRDFWLQGLGQVPATPFGHATA